MRYLFLPIFQYNLSVLHKYSWNLFRFAVCWNDNFFHKLAPNISPKKSVEGVFGGVVGAIIGMILYCLILHKAFSFTPNYWFAVIYGILGSVAAVFGDLCFSVIKRQTGVKDYGNLFPGHGGVLDRFDSVMLTAPTLYIINVIFMAELVKWLTRQIVALLCKGSIPLFRPI